MILWLWCLSFPCDILLSWWLQFIAVGKHTVLSCVDFTCVLSYWSSHCTRGSQIKLFSTSQCCSFISNIFPFLCLVLSDLQAGRWPRPASSWSPSRWRMVAGERILSPAGSADMCRAPPPRSTTPAGLCWGSWPSGRSTDAASQRQNIVLFTRTAEHSTGPWLKKIKHTAWNLVSL